ncbi:MAG: LuxR C-terminal-related transcriptional regulator, partial [Dehalococcoidia bacterium]|nr:LuxR C-terminal-related transcriptional regulator [Dehalococcoidia bacterium]
KTRLAREALSLARERGFTVLEGRALPLEGELAYAPIINAFSPLLRSLGAAHPVMLVDGLPDLGRLFGGLSLPPPEPLGDTALDRTRLFEAMARLLERLTQAAPVALFIDDLHWADPATLDLLHYLARGLADLRALMLATYIEDAPTSSRGLQALIGSLNRDGLAQEVVVPRLEPEAVDRLVRGILGGDVPDELLTLLKARAGGTPLFVEALIGALVDSGHLHRRTSEKDVWVLDAQGASALPPSIRRLILRRLERLAPGDRHVLDLIAILGDTSPYSILQAASGLEKEALLANLRILRDTGLVIEEMDGLEVVYRITHPLIQEVAYSELPIMERRQGHLAAIESLQRFRSYDVSRLARHYRGAGPEASNNHAVAALMSAGEQALALHASEEAARHFDAALTMVRESHSVVNLDCPDGPLLPWLLERLGDAREGSGNREAAVEAWNEALAEREQMGQAVGVSRIRHRLARTEWASGRFDVATAHVRAGLAVLADSGPCEELADLHYVHFQILSRTGDVAGLANAAAEFLSTSEQLASPRLESTANLVVAYACFWQGDVVKSHEHALHALRLAEKGQEQAICCRAHEVLARIGMRLGDHQLMRHQAELGLVVARRLCAPYWELVLRTRLAHAAFMSGDWNESLQEGMRAVVLARRVGYPRDLAFALAGRATILALKGDLPEAEACLAEITTILGCGFPRDRQLFSLVDIAETALALQRGQVDRALGIARGFICPPGSITTPPRLIPPTQPMGLMLLAEVQVAAGEPESALETARALIDLGPPDAIYPAALATLAEGLALQALGESRCAMECFGRAHEAFTTLEMQFEAARSLLEQAVAATDVQPDLAIRAAQQSLATFERLDAQRHVERARRLLQRFGISTLVTRQPRLGGISLTERELEVAQLVAQGMTTAEIAKRLIVTQPTVNSHLQHIYTRLGIGSRTALARIVISAGLLTAKD